MNISRTTKILTSLGLVVGITGTTALLFPHKNTLKDKILEALHHTKTSVLNYDDGSRTKHPIVAKDQHGNYVIAWEHNPKNSFDHFLVFKKFNSHGEIFKKEEACGMEAEQKITPVNQAHGGFNADITMDYHGNFIVTWEQQTSNSLDSYLQRFDTDCKPIGTPTRIHSHTAGDQKNTSISLNKKTSEFIVAWEGEGPLPETTPTTETTTSTQQSTQQTLADTGNIFARRGNLKDGFIQDKEFLVNNTIEGAQKNPDVALNTFNEFTIIWDGYGEEDEQGVYLQSYDEKGKKLTDSNTLVNSFLEGSQSTPSISAITSTGNFVMAWAGKGNGDEDGIFTKRLRRCSKESCILSNVESRANNNTQKPQISPQVTTDHNGNFTITWLTEDEYKNSIHLQQFSFLGSKVNSEVNLTKSTFDDTRAAHIAMDKDGDYNVVWEQCKTQACTHRSATHELQSYTFTSSLNKKGTEFLVNPYTENLQNSPDIATNPNGTRTVIVWEGDGSSDIDNHGIFFSIYDEKGNIVNEKQGALANYAYTEGIQSRPRVSMYDNGDFIVCWDGEGRGDTQGIYIQQFSLNGTAQGTPQRVNETLTGSQFYCDIAVDPDSAGTFIVTWDGTTQDKEQEIIARFFDTYVPSDETVINTTTNGFQGESRVTLSRTGNALIAWSGSGPGDDQGIFAQQYKEVSKKVGSNFRVNKSTKDVQEEPSIASNAQDHFVISWTGKNPDHKDTEIFAKRFKFEKFANPTVIDTDFIVNETSEGDQKASSVALDGIGNFAVMWSSMNENHDGYNEGIYGQLFSVTDNITPLGTEMRINSTTKGSQKSPALAIEKSTGSFTVTWDGNYEKNDQTETHGIAAQRFLSSFYESSNPLFQTTTEQKILSGGRTINAPDVLSFPPIITSASDSLNFLSFSDLTETAFSETSKNDINYIEVKDLLADKNPFNISIIATNFTATADNEPYILAEYLQIRNQDETNTPLETVQGHKEDFSLDSSTDEFVPLHTQQVLATGSGENIGEWRFTPELKLFIPRYIPPGIHTGSIIFSLN